MGPCQGRYCGSHGDRADRTANATPAGDVGYYHSVQPLKPVKLGFLATAATPVDKAVPYKT